MHGHARRFLPDRNHDVGAGAIMAVIGERAEGGVCHGGGGVVVDAVLDETGLARRAIDRQLKFKGPRRWGEGQ